MDSYGSIGSPVLPMALLAAVALLTGAGILLAIARERDRSAAFVIGAAWLRYVMSAFHFVTYRPMVAGLSLNAVTSIAVFAIGMFCINWRHLALRALLPVYVLIAIAIASALANGALSGGLISVLTKYGYLIVIMLSVFGALQRARTGDFMASLLWAFAPVLIFQAASVALGVAKATETDVSSISYIGGYGHEAPFSVMVATCLVVACFAQKLHPYVKFGLIIACIGGILLANYRTTLVAVAPLLLMYFGFSSLQRFPAHDRPFMVSALIFAAGLALGLAALLFAERFADVTVIASGEVNLFKPPDQYSVDESRLASGRPRIWSMYIYAWLQGGPINYLIGLGPEAWSGRFSLYAHNTLVSYLYEYGVLGVAGLLYLWISMLAAALRVRHAHRATLVGAHLSFIMLNMSTMPMWMIEGNILYGIICGYTLYLLSLQKRRAATPARASMPAPPMRA